MNRIEQYRKFNKMVAFLLEYADFKGIPIRIGEVHRPHFVARYYASPKDPFTGRKKRVTGIRRSRHTKSLGIDIWVIDKTGKKIYWCKIKKKMTAEEQDAIIKYRLLAEYWTFLGGEAGYNWDKMDGHHFQLSEPPA